MEEVMVSIVNPGGNITRDFIADMVLHIKIMVPINVEAGTFELPSADGANKVVEYLRNNGYPKARIVKKDS